MQERLLMSSSAQYKAFSHPLRLEILRLLARQAMTNEELARAMGVESGKLYFHTRRLVEAGLIELASTRKKGPITEKLYQPVARLYVVPEPAAGSVEANFAGLMASALQLYQETWQRTQNMQGLLNLGYTLIVHLPPDAAREYALRLRVIYDELRQRSTELPDTQTYAVTALMHSVPTPERTLDK